MKYSMNDLTYPAVQHVAILGSTGSVGVNTLNVISRHPGRFTIFALSASVQVELMLQQCVQFKPTFAVMASEPHGRVLEQKCRELNLATRVLWGSDAINRAAVKSNQLLFAPRWL